MTRIPYPSRGMLTFEAEGTEGGPFHSRKPHVPTNTSGVTLGRGYDMKERTGSQIVAHLTSAGLSATDAAKFRNASEKRGSAASTFIRDNTLTDFEITGQQQLVLFNIAYDHEEAEVRRICAKTDTVKLYGSVEWDALNPAIREVAIDLKFRGDYKTETRKLVQKAIADNDLASFAAGVQRITAPADRYQRRNNFLARALAEQRQREAAA